MIRSFRSADAGYLQMITPSVVLLVVITIIPIFATIYISMNFVSLTNPSASGFIGLENYWYLLEDSRYLNSLRVMFILIVFPVSLQIILGLALAIALKEKLRGTGWMRVFFLLPAVIPPAVSGLVWKLFIVPGAGGVTYLGSLFGADLTLDLLSAPTSALMVIVFCSTWVGTPFVALLFLSSLETIPKDLYEAAHMDGAGWLRSHWSISIPIMRPVIMTVAVFRILEALAIFPVIFILTGGGPAGSTEPVNFYAYVNGFQYLKIDYAASIIVSFFLILMVFCTPFLVRIARSAS